MSFYNRRFKAIATARRNAGRADRRNDGRRIKAYFDLNLAPFHMALRGLKLWYFAEMDAVRLMVGRRQKAEGRRQKAESGRQAEPPHAEG